MEEKQRKMEEIHVNEINRENFVAEQKFVNFKVSRKKL